MIDHVTIKVSDLQKSRTFYQKTFKPLDYDWSFGEEGVFDAFELSSGSLFEIAQYRGEGNITSSHIAFRVSSRELVDAFYAAAIGAGAKNNGKPGTRPNYSEKYYACFILDPDGHNIEAMYDED